jgi:ureidoglycolate hydrolase
VELMNVPENLLDIQQYVGDGYKPIIDYGAWRVAILRYHPELLPDAISAMQRHDETDEVFVLLSGQCILFLGEGADQIEAVHAVDMQPLKAYNIRKGAWHTHTLSHDSMVLIVENQDTRDANSPTRALTESQRSQIVELTGKLWA